MRTLLTPVLLCLTALSSHAALIAGYAFDETSGTTAADAIRGGGGNGTLIGTTGSQWITGHIGGAVDLDGADDYIRAAALTSTYSNFSISAWVNVDANTTWGTIVKSWGDSFHFGLDGTSGYLSNYLNGSLSGMAIDSGTNTLTLDTWHHVAMTFDGSSPTHSHTLYIDGAVVASVTGASVPGSLNAGETYMSIGVKADTTTGLVTLDGSQGFLNGTIDDLGLWNETLNQSQIDTIISNGNLGISSVPEPSAALLGGLGVLALLRRRRA